MQLLKDIRRLIASSWLLVAEPIALADGFLQSETSTSRLFGHTDITVAFETTFDVFTRAGPNNSLEGLTERSIGLVTDRPGNVYELSVALFE